MKLQQWGRCPAPGVPTCSATISTSISRFASRCSRRAATSCSWACRRPTPSSMNEWVEDVTRTGEVPTRVKTRWTGAERLADTYRWSMTGPCAMASRRCTSAGARPTLPCGAPTPAVAAHLLRRRDSGPIGSCGSASSPRRDGASAPASGRSKAADSGGANGTSWPRAPARCDGDP